MFLDNGQTVGKRLYREDSFAFSCHKDLSCFNSCCRNKDLLLTPYDLLRLKNALKIHSDELLTSYTLYRLDPGSEFPVITLKMDDNKKKYCPFVGPDGCKVYGDRPTACRLFPLGRATGINKAHADGQDEFFFLLDIPGCLGIKEKRRLNIDSWLDDQGLLPYTAMNNKMLDLIFHPKRDRARPLNDRQLQNIIVAGYNLDVFREYVYEQRLLEEFKVTAEDCFKIKNNDADLLAFSFNYLYQVLF